VLIAALICMTLGPAPKPALKTKTLGQIRLDLAYVPSA